MNGFFPNTLYRIKFLDDNYLERKEFKIWLGVSKTFTFFTILAIAIAAFGLFGLVSFSVERRTKEIGIRKVLGASVTGILALIAREYIILLIIANAIALPLGTLVATTTPGAYKYQLQIVDYLFPALFIILIALLTTAFRTIKAALSNPVESLRYE